MAQDRDALGYLARRPRRPKKVWLILTGRYFNDHETVRVAAFTKREALRLLSGMGFKKSSMFKGVWENDTRREWAHLKSVAVNHV